MTLTTPTLTRVAAGDDAVLDVRDDVVAAGGGGLVEPADQAGQTGQSGLAAQIRRRLHARRRRIALVLVGLLAFGLFDWAAENVAHDLRQQHLAGALKIPHLGLHPGDAWGVLQVPSIDLDEVVVEGVGAGELRGGPGHLPSSARPSEHGDVVLAGHRERYGGPFSALSKVPVGARVVVRTREKLVRSYTVASVRTQPLSASLPKPGRAERLVLVTSSGGFLSAKRRLVVVANVDSGQSPARGKVPTGHAPPASTLDRRPLGALGALGCVAVLGACVAGLWFAGGALLRRYGSPGAAVVLVPCAVLVAVFGVFVLDLFLVPTL